MRKLILTAISLLAAAFQPIAGTDVTDWYPIVTENRPFVRWWWLGSAVDSIGLTYNLEQFAGKGLGGVEITPIYGVKGNEVNDIDFLSPGWMQMLGHTIAEGDRLGLQIDMNNGTGWPFGGPEVGIEHSARKLVVEKWDAAPGKRFTAKIVPSDKRQRPVATLQSIIAVNGKKRAILTDKLNRDTILNWKAPSGEGEWTIYGIFCGRTLQKVKRAAPGGVGLVVNHYDSVAVNRYLDRFDKAFAESGCRVPDTFFNDSYEVYGADWTDNFPEEFHRDHGYSLELYMPEFLAEDKHDELRSRIVHDYRQTLGRLLQENFTNVWSRRAHALGARIRNQSHGSPANIIDLYAAVDIPECESFGQTTFNIPGLNQDGPTRPSDADPAVLKFASSAAHLTGKRLTSAETLTWLTEHFRTSLSRCKPELDQMFCSGVNHVYFHGAPYSPKGVDFPGWMFYASINMSPTNSIWRDADALFSYISRCQAFLTAGTPDNDFLLYFPIDEVWQRQGGRPYMMFEIHRMDERMPDIKGAVHEIIDAGYDSDYLSDSLLMRLKTGTEGRIVADGGAEYGAIIVPPTRTMSPSTLRQLLKLADEGATIVFAGKIPSDVAGLSDLERRRGELASLAVGLPAVDSVPSVTSRGKGRIITAPDITTALPLIGCEPETMRSEEGLSAIRRRNEAGGYNYFIANLTDRECDSWVKLGRQAVSAEIFDPLNGISGLAKTRSSRSGTTEVRLQLAPGQSLLLKTFPERHDELTPWKYIESKGSPIEFKDGWAITFLQSEPAIDGTFAIDSLAPWTELATEAAKVNFGTGRYTIEFDLPEAADADDWLLDLGDVRESAEVSVNGQPAGKAWAVPFTLRIGHLLHPGSNSLTIDVTNIQANRIADYERRGVEWRIFKDANIASVTNAKVFTFGDWPTLPAGLNSTVRLIPLKY
ncbi:MAG: hypothetical protein NC212_06415 [Staphylococcus sp.]|nr:hypothetical protein [Staphylococcus sp.]